MIISVIGQKGGIGKTSLAVNLAAILEGPGILVDANRQQQSAARRFGDSIPGVQFVASLPQTVERFAVVDTGPEIGSAHNAPFKRSTLFLIPVVPRPLEMDALENTMRALEDIAMEREDFKAMFVLSMARKNNYYEGFLDGMNCTSFWRVAKTVIPYRDAEFRRAEAARKPVVLHSSGAGAAAYRALAKEVLEYASG